MSKKNFKRKGLTGLETAIILIAFVIVAAAFAFVVLNMGFYTAQRSRTVMSAGLGEASSALEIDGSVLAYVDIGDQIENTNVTGLVVYIKLSSGRYPVELSQDKLVISYSNPHVAIDNVYDGTACNLTEIVGDGDLILEEGEKFKISINLTTITLNPTNYGLSNTTDPSRVYLHPHDIFRIEIKPPQGAILTIERIIPPSVDTVTNLD